MADFVKVFAKELMSQKPALELVNEIRTQVEILTSYLEDCTYVSCFKSVQSHASTIVQLCEAGILELRKNNSGSNGPQS